MVRPLDRSLCGAFQNKTALINVVLLAMPAPKGAPVQITATADCRSGLAAFGADLLLGSAERTSGRGP